MINRTARYCIKNNMAQWRHISSTVSMSPFAGNLIK
jgi:hypothetical protein